MITEETLSNWLDVLEEAGHYLEEGATPPPEWLSRLDWLIWDGRRDIESEAFDLPGFVPQSEVDKLNETLSSYESSADALDIENGALEDELENLYTEIAKLKSRLEEIHGLSDKDYGQARKTD